MSYEYRDEILEDIGPEPNCNYDFEKKEYYKKKEELNLVYDLAEISTQHLHNLRIVEVKADEYEAKAKLMDNIYAELKKRDGEAIDSLNVDYYDFGVYVARTIEEYESECDSNA